MTNLEVANCRAWKRKFLTLCFLQEVVRCRSPTALFRYVEWSNVSTDLGVSINGGTWGTPKWMVYNWTSYYNGGKPHFNQMSSLIFSWGPWIPSLRVCFMRRRSKTPRSTEKKTKKHPFGLRYIQIIPDPSRLQNWFKGKSAGRPDIFGQTHGFLCIFPINQARAWKTSRFQQVFLEWGNRSMSHQPCSHVVNGS